MKNSVLALALSAVLVGAVHAEGLSANVAVASKYKFRGQDQSDASKEAVPAIQGGFDYAWRNGFYLGNWNSSIGFANGTEMDFYGGYKGEAMAGVGYDIGLLHYDYPGSGSAALDTTEIYGAVSYSFVSAKYSHTISDEYFGIPQSKNTGYLDLAANVELMKSLTLNAHLGYTNMSSDATAATGAPDYTDYRLGGTYDFGGGLTLGAHAVGANKKDFYGDINKARLIVTLAKAL